METPSLSYSGESARGTSLKEFRLQRKRKRGDLVSTCMGVEAGGGGNQDSASLIPWLHPLMTEAWSSKLLSGWRNENLGLKQWLLLGHHNSSGLLKMHPNGARQNLIHCGFSVDSSIIKKKKVGAHSTVQQGIYPEWSKQNNLSLLAHERANAPLRVNMR